MCGHCSDVNPNSTVTLKVTEIHKISSDRVGLMNYTISDAGDQTSIEVGATMGASRSFPFRSANKEAFTATIKFLHLDKASHAEEIRLYTHVVGF